MSVNHLWHRVTDWIWHAADLIVRMFVDMNRL